MYILDYYNTDEEVLDMSIIVEDGTVASASANSYVSLDYVETYCEDRGLTTWMNSSDDDSKEQAILRAMDYIDSLPFKGVKEDYDNPLQWPRSDMYDEEGYALEDYEIPAKLMRAVAQAAYEEFVSPGVLQPNQTKDDFAVLKKIDVLEYQYVEGKESTVFKKLKGFLSGYLLSSTSVNVERS